MLGSVRGRQFICGRETETALNSHILRTMLLKHKEHGRNILLARDNHIPTHTLWIGSGVGKARATRDVSLQCRCNNAPLFSEKMPHNHRYHLYILQCVVVGLNAHNGSTISDIRRQTVWSRFRTAAMSVNRFRCESGFYCIFCICSIPSLPFHSTTEVLTLVSVAQRQLGMKFQCICHFVP